MVTRLVPGFTQSASSWAPVATLLRDDTDLLDTPEMADFVTVAHDLARDRGTFVGYSQGGRLCLQLALDRPEMVQRLVLVSASPGIADDSDRAARREADEGLAQEIEREGVDAFLDRWLAQPLFATLPRERSGIDERKRANTVERLTYQLRVLGQGAQPSNWGRLGELRIPVLLIAGELDTKYAGIAERMAEQIADVRVAIVPGGGHACHLEQPEHVARHLDSFETETA
jgi:2-succinyl-6-hydroxy-2,4-cyclohexadiene-1-carboxylate synthase